MKAIITIEDGTSGKVNVELEFDPPASIEEVDASLAGQIAIATVSSLVDVIKANHGEVTNNLPPGSPSKIFNPQSQI